MKKYFFINFTVFIISNSKSYIHMSVLSTDKDFFPILEARNKIKKSFDKDIWGETNIVINNFQEVWKEKFEYS